jgi:hypothetical protein
MSSQVCERRWRKAIWVPWLSLVLMLAEIAYFYPQLPAVIASHFNAAGVANGWAPKSQFFTVIVPICAGFLALFTFLASRFPQISGLGWLVMICEYWGAGLFVMLTHATLQYNLGRAKTLDFPILTWSLIMLGALVIGEVGRIRSIRRNANAVQGQILAEEHHGSSSLAGLLLGIGVVMLALVMEFHAAGAAKGALVLVGVTLLICALWARTGFVYRVSASGVEIRTLAMPIRFVPMSDVEFVRAQNCNPLKDFGGWGIRGMGNMRAYIWGGNRCVQIRTHSGDKLYLGITDADRLAREIESLLPVQQV